MNKLKHITIVSLLLLGISIPTILPLFHRGFFTMHDDQQIVRLYQMDKAIKDGQFPVRWVEDLGFGYGYPLFNFYPPLVYYLGEIFHLLFQTSYIISMKLVFGISFVGSAIAMYVWSRKHFGNIAGLISAIFYLYAPYRAVDAYVRGALAEAFSFVWLPLILLSIDTLLELHFKNHTKSKKIKLRQKKLVWSSLLGISYAALMITHNLIVLPFSLLMVVYYLIKLLSSPRKQWFGFTQYMILAGVIGLGLSSFFWLPSLSEMKHTLVSDILLVEKYDHSLHYVEPKQLWNSLWGYGGSGEGALDGFSLKIGKAHYVLAVVIGGFSSLYLFARKNFKQKLPRFFHSVQTETLKPIVGAFIIFSISVWMTTKYSGIFWDNFNPIQFLQFPWRFLSFTTLFASFIAGGSFKLVSEITSLKFFNYIYATVIIFAVLVPGVKLFHPQTYLDVDDSYYTNVDYVRWRISQTSFEFVPTGVKTNIDNELGITQLDITQDSVPTTVADVINGEATIKVLDNQTDYKRILVNSEGLALIEFNVFNFPGWTMEINGKATQINDSNPLKLIGTLVDQGENQITIRFSNTPIRSLANSISCITFVAILGFMVKPTIMSLLIYSHHKD